MISKSAFGKILRRLRKRAKLSEDDVAGVVGLRHAANVTLWEKGHSYPSEFAYLKLKELFSDLPDLQMDLLVPGFGPRKGVPLPRQVEGDYEGVLVRRTRLKKGITQRELASMSGLRENHIAKIEGGFTITPRPATRKKLAVVLGEYWKQKGD